MKDEWIPIYLCFNCLLFTLLAREGFCPGVTGMAEHMSLKLDRWDQRQFTSHIHSQPGEEDTVYNAKPQGSCTWEQSEKPATMGDKLCGIKTVWCPLISAGECDWFNWMLLWSDKELKPLLGTSRDCTWVPLIWKVTGLEDFICGNRVERGTCD